MAKTRATGRTVVIADNSVAPGQRCSFNLQVGQLYTHEPVNMPVQVINGRKAGPTLVLSAAIHGDELNGIEIVRRVLARTVINRLRGTLIAVPVVNVLGVYDQSRYLPDRRDLNRCFPGSETGSLASRMAHQFTSHILSQATHGIDLHTGAIHRSNLPQIRANIDKQEVHDLAVAFGAPVIVRSGLRDGSLRDAASERGIRMLLYEAGEALRFDEYGIRVGVKGVFNVMRELGMTPKRVHKKVSPFVAMSSGWVRAPTSGIFRATVSLGAKVEPGSTLGFISDPFGDSEEPVIAQFSGLVIGRSNLPLVHEGEALYHVGKIARSEAAAARVEEEQSLLYNDPQQGDEPFIV